MRRCILGSLRKTQVQNRSNGLKDKNGRRNLGKSKLDISDSQQLSLVGNVPKRLAAPRITQIDWKHCRRPLMAAALQRGLDKGAARR